MPALVTDSPMGITCVYSDGSTSAHQLRVDSNPALARQLLAALADMVHPHGRLDSVRTIETYLTAVRDLLTRLAKAGFSGDASQLTRGRLSEVWMATTNSKEGLARIVLGRLDDLEGVLRPGVRALIDGRLYNPNTRQLRKTLPPYTEGEWDRLATVCRSVIKESFAAYQHARSQAGRGGDPKTAGWSEQSIQWMLLHQGPQTVTALGRQVRKSRNRPGAVPKALYPHGSPQGLAGLYPGWKVVRAYQLLFGVHTGVVPDGLGELGVDGIDWAGDATVLLDYIKGRSGPESLTLSAKASRLLRQWVEHSSPARAHAPEAMRGDLWIRYNLRSTGINWQSGDVGNSGPRWVDSHGLVDDAGSPLVLHSHRIRTTFESLRDRSGWRGSSRATIDPNHTPQVEGDHYLQVSTPAQKAAVDSIIEEAQHDMLRRAQPPVILHTDDAAELVANYPELVEKLDLSGEVIAELLSGERDVFTAACADQLSGLHGPKGKPCPARPWVCLLCPLVMFAPRHLPNLMRLKAFFARQWKQMPAQQFMAVFGPYASRLDQVLTEDHFTANDLAKAAAHVSDTDSDLPLRAEEMTA